jgi:hypothetical protein
MPVKPSGAEKQPCGVVVVAAVDLDVSGKRRM